MSGMKKYDYSATEAELAEAKAFFSTPEFLLVAKMLSQQ